MSINVISAGYYPTAYANNKTTSVATGASFSNIVEQKSMEADMAKGELDQGDLLGTSVQSAIGAAEKWIYDIDHPLEAHHLAKVMVFRQMVLINISEY